MLHLPNCDYLAFYPHSRQIKPCSLRRPSAQARTREGRGGAAGDNSHLARNPSVLMETLALDFLIPAKTGPRGGDLSRAAYPERRNAHLNNGDTGLHRHEGFEDKSVTGLKNEQPWHAMAAYMLLAGRTNSEIALAAGVTVAAVAMVRSQRWFQEKLAILSNKEGDDILGLLRSEATASLNKMIEIRDAVPETPSVAYDRLAYQAAKDIFELAHGKATQTVVSSVSHTTHASPSEEMESIQQQLAALRASSATKVLALPEPQ